jgi:YggT family protein
LALNLAILGRIVMSWVAPNSDGPIARILYDVTEPILGPFRRIIPRIGMLDISPMVAIMVMQLVEQALRGILRSFLI